MRKHCRLTGLYVFMASICIAVAGIAQDAATSSMDDFPLSSEYLSPNWQITAEALFLQRGSRFPMAESRATTGAPIDQAFAGDQFRPGIRLSAQRFDAAGNSWELAYFGLQRWNENDTVLGDPAGLTSLVRSPSLRYDDIIGGFDTSVTYSYRAQTHNAEINRWFSSLNDGDWKADWLLGFRYFNFEERLTATGIDARFGTENLDSAAFNSLFGLQLGSRIERTWERFSLFALGKAGVYANNWSYRVDDVVVPNVGFPPPNINLVNRGFGVAGILETRAGFRYQWTEFVALTGGYTVLYVPGAALQPNLVGVERRPSNGLLLHGASIGLDLCW